MSLDHDLQNLAPLADEDREARETGYVAMANSIPGNSDAAEFEEHLQRAQQKRLSKLCEDLRAVDSMMAVLIDGLGTRINGDDPGIIHHFNLAEIVREKLKAAYRLADFSGQ